MITEIHHEAQAALRTSPIYDLRKLRVEQVDEMLLICGKVGSFYHKQLAQEAVRLVSGDYQVVNKIDVETND
jgi:osmotically-inducible protein OsmY